MLISEAQAIWRQEGIRLQWLAGAEAGAGETLRVLGRAVAHEIGHFLLQSNTHAANGLMRARIDAQEFADPSRISFRLDQETQRQLSRSRSPVEIP